MARRRYGYRDRSPLNIMEEVQYCPECGEEMHQNHWFYPGDGHIKEENETYYACSNCYYSEFEYSQFECFECEDISRN